MKKLLGILGTITIAGSGISGIVGNAPTIRTNRSRVTTVANNTNVINLNQLKANDSSIDLSYLNGTNPSEDTIKEAILISISSNNSSKISNIVTSLLTEKDKWRISGIVFKIPNSGATHTYNAKFFSLDSSKYLGVLSVKVTLSSLDNVKNLNEVIINKNSLTIEDYDKNNILKILKEKNSTLDINEIDVDMSNLTYKSANIRAKQNSSKYFGSVIISFIPEIKLKQAKWESDYISLSSYSGPETKTSSHKFKYTATLGKNNFMSTFNKIKIKFSGNAVTSRPQWVTRDFASQYKEFDITSDSQKYYFWYEEQQWTGNYDASVAWLNTSWENNTFVLETAAWIKVDSSAWVTDRSEAKSKLKIEEVKFE